jgi:Spy/CpxP family protein refolding chaperone
MFRLCVILASALALCSLVAEPGVSGDKKEPPVKKLLPQGWGKLGLSEEQRTKIYEIRGKYAGKIEALKKQLEDLRDTETADMLKILTEGQREQLRQAALKKAGDGGKKTTDDKKPAEDKKKEPDKK